MYDLLMYSLNFWRNAILDRGAKSFAQALLLVFLGDSALNVINVNWPEALGLASTAALISVLTSIVSSPVGPEGSPSIVKDSAASRT